MLRREEKKLLSGQGLSALPAAPARLQAEKPAHKCYSGFGLRLLAQTAVLMAIAGGAVSVRADVPVCPALLMDSECAQYQQQLKLASSETQRNQVVREYAQIQSERRRACPISEKLEQQILQYRATRQRYGQVN